MATLYIDAMNVIGSRPDGWWRDRDAAVRRLVDELQTYAGSIEADVVLVADGRPPAELPEGRHGAVDVRFASRSGRNAADDRILHLIATAADGDDVEVVTADRDLRRRVRSLGARVVGPRDLLDRLAGTRPPRGCP